MSREVSDGTPHGALTGTGTVLLAGATGLVGRELLRLLVDAPSVQTIHCVGRRPLADPPPKVVAHVVDLMAPGPLPRADLCLIALGTTIKVAGSQAAQYAVDHDAVLAVAKAAKAAGCERLGVVSAMGANAKSRIFYNRVKGETEDDLQALGFSRLVIARPSFLIGDRGALGQPIRAGEGWAESISRWLRPLLPADLRSIEARKVAAALLREARAGSDLLILPSGQMQ